MLMTYVSGPKITSWQHQIIIGTIIGGSSVIKPKRGKNAYISMRSNNKKWIEYKANELKNLASPLPFSIEVNNYIRWHSMCFPEFNEYKDKFYIDGKKKISLDILNELRDIGISVWFLDNATIEKNQIVFHPQVFGEEGVNTINKYFNEISFNSEIIKKGKTLHIKICKDSTEKFIKTIGYRIPKFMMSIFSQIEI